MMQFLAIILALSLIVASTKFKLNLGLSLLFISVISGFIGGLSPELILNSFTTVFTDFSTSSLLLIVLEVGLMCGVMQHYQMLAKIDRALKRLVPSVKALIMIMPAIIGVIAVPGGAGISAPFANSLGDELGIDKSDRAALNVIFRHLSMFILPISATLILASTSVPGTSVYTFMLLCLPFVLINYPLAYFIYLRKIPNVKSTVDENMSKGRALFEFFFYLSPVLIPIIVNSVFGTPIWLAMAGGMVIAIIIAKSADVFSVMARYIIPNAKIVFLLIGVYFFRNIMLNFSEMMDMFSATLASVPTIVALLLVALMALLFGSCSGLPYVPIGIVLPLLASMGMAGTELLQYASFAYVWCILGYLYAPTHLCQILSNQCVQCNYFEGLKSHFKMIPYIIPVPFIIFYIYGMVL